MPALSIYVEPSVWSHAFAEDAPESKAATMEFFDRAAQGKYELFVSEIVLAEISRAPEELGTKLQGLLRKTGPVLLEFDQESDELAQQFLGLGAVPPAKIEDAQHVAVAVINELDILVSWNFRHLVNVRRREVFQHASAMSGYYKPLHIVTPPEVSDESE